MVTVYTEVEVDVELDQFDTDDLVNELKSRGYDYAIERVDTESMRETLEDIWYKRRLGRDYQEELDRLIYGVLGKLV
jgi:hypothetical protein